MRKSRCPKMCSPGNTHSWQSCCSFAVQSTLLDQAGKPAVDALSGFLTGNPLTSAAAKQIAEDPNVKGVFATIKGVADVIGPMENALLVRYCRQRPFDWARVTNFQCCTVLNCYGS